jgi:hypothetical protein
VPERDLAASVRRHTDGGLPRPAAELIDRLTDHFVRVVPPANVTWVHPSWRDLVIERLAADAEARRRFLGRCSLDGVLLALSRGGGRAGERIRPLLRSDGDWDAIDARVYELVPELDDSGLTRLLAALDDGLRSQFDHSASERAAVAFTALDRLARCWDAKRSFPSEQMIQRWRSTCALLREGPEPPSTFELWRPARGFPFNPPPNIDVPLFDPVFWDDEIRTPQERIVDRILADLDAA